MRLPRVTVDPNSRKSEKDGAYGRDLGLSALAWEAVTAAIVTELPSVKATGAVGAVIALRALLPDPPALTTGEQILLKEWLDRLTSV